MDHAPADSASNRLAVERSPYLRQHARNPVEWYSWGPEALERARREGRPILLSIGYAACHWCHVMAHESFEDQSTAAVMNELFVNIKVDREERPDLDRIYQLAHSMLTGRGGGWPLTMFLMHDDQRPFFGGTYFPGEARHGLPAFKDVLSQVARYYHGHLQELREPAGRIVAALDDLNPPAAVDTALSAQPLLACRAMFERSFDARNGGFGAAPKFPHAASIVRLLHDWHASANEAAPDLQALYMATLTLTRMGEGGLFDQLGGGFYRYSVDDRWEIPHFEKMLYDNAQLLSVYAEAAWATGESEFGQIAARTAQWMLDEMRSSDGAFFASLDADSEGHEGRFYVWDAQQIQSHLTAPEYALFSARYGLQGAPNFEGSWHLVLRASVAELAKAQQLPVAEVEALLESAQRKLLALRAQRVRPGLDDKILTSWNALAIGALARAGRLLDQPHFIAAAGQALQYLRAHHWHEGRLYATDAHAGVPLRAYLDDYVFLIDALLELAGARVHAEELQFAIELTELLLQHFQDPLGGFFFTADDHEALITRPKSFGDESLPAGNAIAASVLLRLGYLLGESRYLHAAERTLQAAWGAVEKYPQAHASLLQALELYLHPSEIVLLSGPAHDSALWQAQASTLYAPQRWVLRLPDSTAGLPQALLKPAAETAVAYVCQGSTCSAPIRSIEQLLQELH